MTFAVPQESRDFRRAIQATAVDSAMFSGSLARVEVRVLHTGMGGEAAGRALTAVVQKDRPRQVIGAGFAGGLDPRLDVGSLVVGTNVSAPEMLTCCRALAGTGARVSFGAITSKDAPVKTAPEKSELARNTLALAVDMETAALAETCALHGVPFLAVRAISDRASDPLPIPFTEWYDIAGQTPRPFALVRYLVGHPSSFRSFVRFLRGLAPAQRALADFLIRCLEADGAEKNPRLSVVP